MFPEIRLVNGRAITVESTAAGLRGSTCYRCGEARGHTEELQRHYQNMAREAGEKGTSGASAAVASSSTSPPWAAKAPPPRSVPPRTSSTLLGLLPSLSRKWTRSTTLIKLLFFETVLALFETCDLPRVFLMRFVRVIPPHRPPTRKAPKVSREQILLNMKKKLEKEEQELRDR